MTDCRIRYGDNFAYSGDNVRPVEGALELRLNARRQIGKPTVSLQTSEASGPLHVSAEQSFDGEITLVSQIDPSSTVNEEGTDGRSSKKKTLLILIRGTQALFQAAP